MGAFENLLSVLQRRTKMEHDSFVEQQLIKQRQAEAMGGAIEEAGKLAGGIIAAIKRKKMIENEYQYMADQTGLFQPETIATAPGKEENKFAELKAGLLKRQQNRRDRSGVASAQAQQRVTEGKEKEYRGSEEFLMLKTKQAFRTWLKQNPVGSPKYIEVVDKFRQMQDEGGSKLPDKLTEYEEKLKLRNEYAQPKTSGVTYKPTQFNKDILTREKEWESNLISDGVKDKALEAIRSYRKQYVDVQDPATLENAIRELDVELSDIKSGGESDDRADQSKKGESIVQRIFKPKASESKKQQYIQALRDELEGYPKEMQSALNEEFSTAVKDINLAESKRAAAKVLKKAKKRMEQAAMSAQLKSLNK